MGDTHSAGSSASGIRTIGMARREAGIPESDYLRRGDGVDRIETIRCLVRQFGPPDDRTEHLDGCNLYWSSATGVEDRRIYVKTNGSITS